MRFTEQLPRITRAMEKIGSTSNLSEGKLLKTLEKCCAGTPLDTGEIIELMNALNDEDNRHLVRSFSASYQRPHAEDILLLPPLYFSSICENQCRYCQFSTTGKRLLSDEFRCELEALTGTGYRSIELVSSQDPELFLREQPFDLNNQVFNIERVLDYFRISREHLNVLGGGMLTSNIPPLDRESFERLHEVPLDCYLSWVETFNQRQYMRLHPEGTPKTNQMYRLDAFERAIEAGIPHVAGAFLKGLYDWRKEETILYLFHHYLKEKSGRGFSIIGSPRLKGKFARSPAVKPYAVSDEEYELNIALDRILFDGLIWLQTRESFSFNKTLLQKYGGGIILTIDCSTAPGGYSNPARTRAQFPVYKKDVNQAVEDLKEAGFQIYFEWDSKTLSEYQRR